MRPVIIGPSPGPQFRQAFFPMQALSAAPAGPSDPNDHANCEPPKIIIGQLSTALASLASPISQLRSMYWVSTVAEASSTYQARRVSPSNNARATALPVRTMASDRCT